jgi:formylglycine-generating enzyme required for sulfatase activity
MPDDDTQDAKRTKAFVARKPILAVLSDAPLDPSSPHLDRFNLFGRAGPIYDILRHKDTRTPLAIAIHGDWGSGKSSAMRWLEGLLGQWNGVLDKKSGDARVHTVWFEPWKYQTREDVWRGLIAEVLIKSISASPGEMTVPRVIKASKDFGMFLGRSFLHALRAIKVKPDSRVEISPGDAIEEIYKDWRATAHPEKAYLNEFEETLRHWIAETVKKPDRLVVFIDDLDRCLPNVALEVLEALKLYLNIEGLIFVVGVAPDIVNALVVQHYKGLGVDERYARNYLSKIFQLEVPVSADTRQIEGFLNGLLSGAQVWKESLEPGDKGIIQRALKYLAQGNPREVKRMVNEVLLYGRAVLMADETSDKPDPGTMKKRFAQAMQRRLIRRILKEDDRYAAPLRQIDKPEADDFFRVWSGIVRDKLQAPRSFPEAWTWLDPASRGELDAPGQPRSKPAVTAATADVAVRAPELPQQYKHFQPLLDEPKFRGLCLVLDNAEVGELMLIEYPTAEEVAVMKAVEPLPDAAPEGGTPREILAAIERAEAAGKSGEHPFADPLLPLRDPEHRHWVQIPAGEFLMGAQNADAAKLNYDPQAGEEESPCHKVQLAAYRIGRYPVTVCEYARFIDEKGYSTEAFWSAGGFKATEKPQDWKKQIEHPTQPVVGVSWHEAMAYTVWATGVLKKAGKPGRIALPTEAQWERAARGPEGRKYPWGKDEPDGSRLNFDGSEIGHPTPVGVYHQKGATPEGICDLAGNVWEWCADGYSAYTADGVADPVGEQKPNSLRVLRGGSWRFNPSFCRSAYRASNLPGTSGFDYGFRLCLDFQ